MGKGSISLEGAFERLLSDADIREEEEALRGAGAGAGEAAEAAEAAGIPSSSASSSFVPFMVSGGAHRSSPASAKLVAEIGGIDALRKLTTVGAGPRALQVARVDRAWFQLNQ